ncbi:MAG: hypothetical protein NZ896_06620, partial [Nitrososphaerales archaeon]|nr:hypothetical protein [Nitrososphaerales archaeon]
KNVSLPMGGRFKVIVEVDGVNATRIFVIDEKSMLIKIKFEGYTKGSDPLILTLLYLSIAIIIAEIFIAIKIWSRAIRLTSKFERT